MPTQDDVRRIALSLPEAVEGSGRFSFGVGQGTKPKSFAWVWLERVHPKKGRVPQPAVLAVRVSCEEEKFMYVDSDPDVFTEDHYNGYPAVLIRLAAIELTELDRMITQAWIYAAPKKLSEQFESARIKP